MFEVFEMFTSGSNERGTPCTPPLIVVERH